MSFNSWPWPSNDGDRVLTAADISKFIKGRESNGVASGLVVMPYSGMTVKLTDGHASVNGKQFMSETDSDGIPTTLDCGIASGSYPKYVSVFLQLNTPERTVTPIIKSGAPSNSPVKPAVQRDSNIYELRLADILIPTGATAINQAMITNTIAGPECGVSVNQPLTVDTEQFALQMNAWLPIFQSAKELEFTQWFDQVKNVLDENTAGNLYNMITAIPRIIIQEGDEVPPVVEGAILIRK